MKICLITLGCPKNIVEGESIAGLLRDGGWELTTDISAADAAIVHTCSFIADAKKESENVITQLSLLREHGKLRKLAVTGCLVQKEGLSLQRKFRYVDVFAGTGRLNGINGMLLRGNCFDVSKPGGLLESTSPRLLSSGLPSAYLRLSEGCNHKCSFCVIPEIRGRYKSREKLSILDEAKELVSLGIKEINLIAQDTTMYGRDIYGKPALPQLLNKLGGINGIRWIRLMYAFPSTVTGQLLRAIKNIDRVCKYIDMPVQHVNDRVLGLMGRPQGVKKLIKHLKEAVPGITLRSTLITGFPGETKKEFKELASFVSEGWFDNLGVFEYCPAGGTPSSAFSGRVSSMAARERKEELMLRQKKVVGQRYHAMKGMKVEALVEYVKKPGVCAGRTVFQAPEIDGGIIINGRSVPGRFVKARITGYKGYDLHGEI